MNITKYLRHCLAPLTLTALLIQLAGCSSPMSGPYQSWLDKDPDQWQYSSSDSLHRNMTLLAQSGQVSQGQTIPVEPWLEQSPDADAYVIAALKHNPSIRAARRQVARFDARVDQATSLDDPMFQIAPVGEMAETAAGQVTLMSSLSQKLPFPGKLETRGRIAEQDVAIARIQLHATCLQIAAQTRKAYWRYYYTTQAILSTHESQSLLSRYKDMAQVQYETGKRNQSDLLRASLELGILDNKLVTLRQQQATTRGMLNQLLDRPINANLPEPAEAQIPTKSQSTKPQLIKSQSLEILLTQAANTNPDILEIHQRIEQYRQYRKLARLARWPDLTASVAFNAVDDRGISGAANGKDQWWLGIGVNLPVWFKKYDAQDREALQGLLENMSALTAEQNRVAYDIQDAWLRIESQQKLLETFSQTLIPTAQLTIDASTSGYQAGTEDFLTLIDSWQKLLDFKLLYQRALVDKELAVTDMQQLIGSDLSHTPSQE